MEIQGNCSVANFTIIYEDPEWLHNCLNYGHFDVLCSKKSKNYFINERLKDLGVS